MILHYSEDRWYALHHVAELMVMHHTTSEVTAPGFSWTDTPMTEGLHSVLKELLHAQLIRIGPHRPWGCPAGFSADCYYWTSNGVCRCWSPPAASTPGGTP